MLRSSLLAICLLLAAASSAHGNVVFATTRETPSPVAIVLASPPPSVCSNAASPDKPVSGGSSWEATLSGLKNIKPNTTGVPMPLPGKASGTYQLQVDEKGRRASWTLKLCDIPQYTASHLHTGSPKADFAPPLIPLEPYTVPANPFGPPELLPQLCPPREIKGCSYTSKGSFTNRDIIPLLGRQPQGDQEAPSVTDWNQFLSVLKAGKIYVNVHSKTMPAGLIRGNLAAAGGGGGGAGKVGGGGGGGESSGGVRGGSSSQQSGRGESSGSQGSGSGESESSG